MLNSPIEDVLNLAVFAPLGVALAVKDAVPEWISRGREQFETARAVGELVTDYGQKKVARTLVGLGILPGPPPPAPESPPPTAGEPPPTAGEPPLSPGEPPLTPEEATSYPEAPAVAGGVGQELAAPSATGLVAPAALTPSTNGHVGEAAAAVASPAEPDELAIPGYDSLSASQVVSRLPGLAPGELEAVRVYELASRGRRTILTKISQLQTGWS